MESARHDQGAGSKTTTQANRDFNYPTVGGVTLYPIAFVQTKDVYRCSVALEKAGIVYTCGGSLGMTFCVSNADFARAKDILRADALSHGYTIRLDDGRHTFEMVRILLHLGR